MENTKLTAARGQRQNIETQLANGVDDSTQRAALQEQLDRARQAERESEMEAQRQRAAITRAREKEKAAQANAEETYEDNSIGADRPTPADDKAARSDVAFRTQEHRAGDVGLGAVRETYTVTVMDPALAEAYEANARAKQMEAESNVRKEAQARAAQEAESQKRRDMERDALTFEGVPSRGFTVEDYSRLYQEVTEQTATRQEIKQDQETEQTITAAAQLTEDTGQSYRAMQKDEELTGEVVDVVEVQGKSYLAVAENDAPDNAPLILVPNRPQMAHGADIDAGDQVQISRTSQGHQVEPVSYDYGM